MLKGMSKEEDQKAESERRSKRGFKYSRAAARQWISENA